MKTFTTGIGHGRSPARLNLASAALCWTDLWEVRTQGGRRGGTQPVFCTIYVGFDPLDKLEKSCQLTGW